MSKSISKWFQKRHSAKEDETPTLPTLPHQRLRALTSSASVFNSYGIFQRLPSELRRKILVEAFGNQTVHMDIRLCHPGSSKHVTPCDPARSHAQQPLQLIPDTARPKKWQWWSCVCHRSSPSSFGLPRGAEPCEDDCRNGCSDWCDLWPGQAPGKCYIGIMGWLLSCRQAYTEGIEILYSTNTIHITSPILLQNLPKLLLPHRLATVTSLELLWHPESQPHRSNPLTSNEDRQHSDCEPFDMRPLTTILPSTFPRLRCLYISLHGNLNIRHPKFAETIEATETAILSPIDNMIRGPSFPHLQDCNIALSASLYVPRKIKATGKLLPRGRAFSNEFERLWREVSMEAKHGEQEADEAEEEKQKRKTTMVNDGKVNNGGRLKGYWLRLGVRDMAAGAMYDMFD